jgi:acyl-CoA synthetase (NDP forming)
VADYVDVLADDGRIAAIGLYLESIPDVPAFAASAAKALARGVPLVLLKGGVTTAGSAKALTHSGALALPDRLLTAFARRYGIVRVGSLAALIETLKMLAIAGVPAGPRLGAITLSGGIATVLADRASEAGLEMPLPATASALRPLVPAVLPIANPLDCSPPLKALEGLSMMNEGALTELFTAMLGGGYDAGLLCIDFPHPRVGQGWLWEPSARAMTRAAATAGIPCAVASMLPEALPETTRRALAEAGIAPLQGLDEAVGAIAAAVRYGEARRREPAPPLLDRMTPMGRPRLRDEVESKRLLALAGLAIPAGRIGGLGEVGRLAEAIGFPVALKAVSERLPHKAAVGALALGLRDRAAVEAAAATIAENIRRADSGFAVERFLIEAMVEGAVAEAMVGVTRDPAFGLVLILGTGGVEVERAGDTCVLLLPTTKAEVERALARLDLGYRLRERNIDPGGLADAVLAVARLGEAMVERLDSLDVNPILVLPDGRVIAVDALASFVDPVEGEG